MNIDYAEFHKTLGINIAYYRKMKGLTQLQLAEKSEISRTYVSRLEAPKMIANLSVTVLFKIANALEVPPSNLLK